MYFYLRQILFVSYFPLNKCVAHEYNSLDIDCTELSLRDSRGRQFLWPLASEHSNFIRANYNLSSCVVRPESEKCLPDLRCCRFTKAHCFLKLSDRTFWAYKWAEVIDHWPMSTRVAYQMVDSNVVVCYEYISKTDYYLYSSTCIKNDAPTFKSI